MNNRKSIIGLSIFLILFITMVSISVFNEDRIKDNVEIKKIYGNEKVLDDIKLYSSIGVDEFFSNTRRLEIQRSTYSKERGFFNKGIGVLGSKGIKFYGYSIKKDKNADTYYRSVDIDGHKHSIYSDIHYDVLQSHGKTYLKIYDSWDNKFDIRLNLDYDFKYKNFQPDKLIYRDGRYLKFIMINDRNIEKGNKVVYDADIYLLKVDMKDKNSFITKIKSYKAEYIKKDNPTKAQGFFLATSLTYTKKDVYLQTSIIKNYEEADSEEVFRDIFKIEKSTERISKVRFLNNEVERIFVESYFSSRENVINDDLVGVLNTDKNLDVIKFYDKEGVIGIEKKRNISNIIPPSTVTKDNKTVLNFATSELDIIGNRRYQALILKIQPSILSNKLYYNNFNNQILLLILDNNDFSTKYMAKIGEKSDYDTSINLKLLPEQ